MRHGNRLLLLILPACLSVSAVAASVVNVSQKARAFNVSTVQIARGDTISFNNEDTFRHQIYVESPSFNYESDEQSPGTSVGVTFTKSGIFEVRCHIHPKMHLQVEVR